MLGLFRLEIGAHLLILCPLRIGHNLVAELDGTLIQAGAHSAHSTRTIGPLNARVATYQSRGHGAVAIRL